MNNYDNYCTKLFGGHTCTEKDCPTCPVAQIIAEHDSEIRADERKAITKWIVENVPTDCYGCCGTKCFQDGTTDCATELLRCYEKEQNDEGKG